MPWTKVCIDKLEFENTLAKDGLRGLSYRQAIKEAQELMLEQDRRVFIIGEGIDDPFGIFDTTVGFADKFGKDRIIDIPIAENALTGIAIGAAMNGMRPIFVHMRMDFLPMCMDQIINHAAKWHYMTGGNVNIPLVIRSIIGRGWGSAAQHSQALHALFTHIPGLKVVMPATPYDAKGLLISALNDGNPIMFIEHRWIYDYIGFVPEERYEVPIGKGILIKRGSDITVVATSHMLYETVKANKILEKEGIDIEIIDPRTLKPLDEELILNSVKKTGRLIIADVGCKTSGIAAEIVAKIFEKEHGILKAPIERICLPDIPAPASSVLEKEYYPTSEDIVEAARKVVKYGFDISRKISVSSENNELDISVIMPARNYEKYIQAVINITLKALDDSNLNGEMIVINDASSDNTEIIVKRLMEKEKRIRMLTHDVFMGVAKSFWDGVEEANAEAIIMLPGNNENDPWEIFRYYRLLENVEVVIPFIFNKQDRLAFRNILSLIYRYIINSTFLLVFNYTNGAVLYRKSILKGLNFRSTGFFFQTDILIRIAKSGHLFAEVPYRIGLRNTGVLIKKTTFPTFWQVVKGYIRLVRDYYFNER